MTSLFVAFTCAKTEYMHVYQLFIMQKREKKIMPQEGHDYRQEK